MARYSYTLTEDAPMLQMFDATVRSERETTADMLAQIGEIDARKLYLLRAYPTMHAYLVGHQRFTDDVAYKRIQAARVARSFPAVFLAIAAGRLSESAVLLLKGHLTEENSRELLAAALDKPVAELRALLAARGASGVTSAGTVQSMLGTSGRALDVNEVSPELDSNPILYSVTEHAGEVAVLPDLTSITFTLDAEGRALLKRLQELSSHRIPSGDLGALFKQLMAARVRELDRRKFGKTANPRQCRASAHARTIPADVRRAVHERDGAQCTFVSDQGRRCEARDHIEFDHITPVARGGHSTPDNLRLLCRAHNQHLADRTYGAGFMHEKREAARLAREAAQAAREAAKLERQRIAKHVAEIVPYLTALGIGGPEARRAAQHGAAPVEATLEERVRISLKALTPAHALPRPAFTPFHASSPAT